MKKILTSLIVLTSLTLNLCAQEEDKEKSDFYIVTKALMILGDTVKHGDATLSGSLGYGIGVDLGYKLEKGFSVEIDATYATSDVTEQTEHGHKITVDASYITTSLALVYIYPIVHHLEIFGKVGFEYEIEKINDLDIDTSDTGFIYAIGLEYEMNEHVSLLGEYEATTIEGPRGNSMIVGVIYHF